jgi:hypothetical protein
MPAHELPIDLIIFEHYPLIHLTGKTPCRGEIDKDGFPLVSRCSECGIGERLPLKPIGMRCAQGRSQGCNDCNAGGGVSPAAGRPAPKDPSSDSENYKPHQQTGNVVGAGSRYSTAEMAVDPDEPNDREKQGNRCKLLQCLHPAARPRQPSRPPRDERQRGIGQRQAERKSREDCEGNNRIPG